jgi:hypothetical protein
MKVLPQVPTAPPPAPIQRLGGFFQAKMGRVGREVGRHTALPSGKLT